MLLIELIIDQYGGAQYDTENIDINVKYLVQSMHAGDIFFYPFVNNSFIVEGLYLGL